MAWFKLLSTRGVRPCTDSRPFVRHALSLRHTLRKINLTLLASLLPPATAFAAVPTEVKTLLAYDEDTEEEEEAQEQDTAVAAKKDD